MMTTENIAIPLSREGEQTTIVTEIGTASETDAYRNPSLWNQIWSLRNILIVILTPVISLPVALLFDDQKTQCTYVILVMGVLWLTEAVPIPATSLLPFFLFPLGGILPAKTATAAYMNDTSMLFFGGLIMAVAIETWNLHKRIALKVLMLVGTEPKWLLAGMMATTWFLSMWISNTATTGMMITIAQGVLQQLKATSGHEGQGQNKQASHDVKDENGAPNGNIETETEMHIYDSIRSCQHLDENTIRGADHGYGSGETHVDSNFERTDITDHTAGQRSGDVSAEEEARHQRMCKALSLCVCYSANIGGIASLTGTGPNIVLKGQADIVFESLNATSPITFASFLVYGLPLSLLVLLLLWGWMVIYFRLGNFCSCLTGSKNNVDRSHVASGIRNEYLKLGPVSYAEKSIMAMFGTLIILWITRDLGSVGGWGDIFKSKYVTDSAPALLMAFLLFVFPSTRPNIFCCRDKKDRSPPVIQPILRWQDVHERMPWSVFLILGAGYCLAKASEESGLSSWVGTKLQIFGDLNPYLMLLVLCYITCFVTEVTSNVATATLMLPIMAQLALSLRMNPLFFMFPTALTISFAFMMPVATPPNAIAFSYGHLRVMDMVGCGFMMNLLSVPAVVLATYTWGNAYFHFDTLPEGIDLGNGTAVI